GARSGPLRVARRHARLYRVRYAFRRRDEPPRARSRSRGARAAPDRVGAVPDPPAEDRAPLRVAVALRNGGGTARFRRAGRYVPARAPRGKRPPPRSAGA